MQFLQVVIVLEYHAMTQLCWPESEIAYLLFVLIGSRNYRDKWKWHF